MPDGQRTILTAVLAAGLATRFGGAKLDAIIRGAFVGSWSINALEEAGLTAGIIIVGPQRPQFCNLHPKWNCIINAEPEAGIGSSIRLAVHHAEQMGSDALLIALADMPMVTPDHFKQVAAAQGMAATRYNDGSLGVPARIPQKSFSDLADSCGQRGASEFLSSHPSVQAVQVDPAILVDIDTPSDLSLFGHSGGG